MATTPASIAVNRCAPPEASTLLHERTRAPRATALVYSTQPQPHPQAQQHRRHFRVATVLVVSANSAPYRTPIVSPALARAYSLPRVPTRIRSAPHCNITRVSVAKRLRCLSFLVSRAAVLSLSLSLSLSLAGASLWQRCRDPLLLRSATPPCAIAPPWHATKRARRRSTRSC